MAYFKISRFAELISVSPQTLRNWDKSDKLRPHHVSPSGYRYYSEHQIRDVLGPRYREELKEELGL